MNLGNLSQIAHPNIGLLVQIHHSLSFKEHQEH